MFRSHSQAGGESNKTTAGPLQFFDRAKAIGERSKRRREWSRTSQNLPLIARTNSHRSDTLHLELWLQPGECDDKTEWLHDGALLCRSR